MATLESIKLLRDKLEFLRREEATTADPEKKFELKVRIGALKAKIADREAASEPGAETPTEAEPTVSFLDQPTVDFSRRDVRALWDLLVLAYGDPTIARQKATAAGLVPGTWPGHPQLRATWHDAIEVLALQGKLRRLVELAAEDPEIVGFQDRFRDFLSTAKS